MSETVKEFFARYEAAFDARDSEAAAGLFYECCIAASPTFIACTRDADELRAALANVYGSRRATGMRSAKVLGIEETPIDEMHSLARVHWAAYFDKLGDEPVTFDVTYLVRVDGDGPKVVLFISHEDENDLLREKGLIPAQ